MSTASAASAPAVPSLPDGREFADWLSPILVKELRQGLKSRMFVGIFIVAQVIMLLLMAFELITAANDSAHSTSSDFESMFWMLVGIPLILLMPARGLGTVSEEVRANTLDLVRLTRMGAFRIVFGKWIALAAQSSLLIAAVLPYAVLRYYFGEVDVFHDLMVLLILLGASFTVTAGAIALSSVHLIVRIIFLVGFFFTGLGGLSLLFDSGSTTGEHGGWVALMYLGWYALYTWFFLEIAAARIAPAAENHAAVKRSAALLLALVALGVSLFGGSEWGAATLMILCPLWLWVIFEALTEESSSVKTIYAPFLKRGVLGRIAARVLCPGWATGVLFTTLLAICIAWVAKVGLIQDMRAGIASGWTAYFPAGSTTLEYFPWLIWCLVLFTLLTPVLAMIALPRVKMRMAVYALVQFGYLIVYGIASAAGLMDHEGQNPFTRLLGLFPGSALLAIVCNGGDKSTLEEMLRVPFISAALIISAVLAWRMLREFRQISEYERELVTPELDDLIIQPSHDGP